LGAVLGTVLPAVADVSVDALLSADPRAFTTVQQESDYRVIAARCGTPRFEHGFFKESKAAVQAGLVGNSRNPDEVERMVTEARRNPLLLVSKSADCKADLATINDLREARKGVVKPAHAKGAHGH
jgi:hypothetical protein